MPLSSMCTTRRILYLRRFNRMQSLHWWGQGPGLWQLEQPLERQSKTTNRTLQFTTITLLPTSWELSICQTISLLIWEMKLKSFISRFRSREFTMRESSTSSEMIGQTMKSTKESDMSKSLMKLSGPCSNCRNKKCSTTRSLGIMLSRWLSLKQRRERCRKRLRESELKTLC